MRTITMFFLGLAFMLAACSSDGPAVDSAAPADVVPTPTSVIPSLVPEPSPTPVLVPTIVATPTQPTATVAADDADADADPSPTATVTVGATATPRPIPTAAPTSTPVPPPPQPTATRVPATPVPPTPVPTTAWVNPDCYVGPGAADEPVWWCGGKICWANAPHYGCPTTPPVPRFVEVGCTVSDRNIVVNEVITLKAFQDPINVPITFAFEHGDGTVDYTPESRAYYEAPGSYDVIMRWNHGLQGGRTFCGTVVVTAGPTPVPTGTPAVEIGCTVSDRDIVVNEVITLQATQSPANVPVSYVFDHGDGTLDATSQSKALYLAPGLYEVRLQWAHSGTSGVISCGTVTVAPVFSAASYLGRTAASAESFATSQGLTLRIVRIDDTNYPGTTDYRLDRVNVEIDDGVVTKAYLG